MEERRENPFCNYQDICSEKFEEIKADLQEIKSALYKKSNGNASLLVRVDRLEQRNKLVIDDGSNEHVFYLDLNE